MWTESFSPKQLHKDTNFLWQCAAVQLLLQQQLPIKEWAIISHPLDTLYLHQINKNRSELCLSNLLQTVGCRALNLRWICVSLWIPLSPSPSSAADMLLQHIQTSRRTQACPELLSVVRESITSTTRQIQHLHHIYDSRDNNIHDDQTSASCKTDWFTTQHTILVACFSFGTLQLQNRQSLGFDLQHTIQHLQTWKHFQTVVQWWMLLESAQ